MVDINAIYTQINMPSTGADPVSGVLPKSTPKSDENTPEPGGRVIHDRVEISGSSESMVNLSRGQDLADEIRAKPVDANFASDLRKALEDIFRITRLFAETIKGLFQINRT